MDPKPITNWNEAIQHLTDRPGPMPEEDQPQGAPTALLPPMGREEKVLVAIRAEVDAVVQAHRAANLMAGLSREDWEHAQRRVTEELGKMGMTR